MFHMGAVGSIAVIGVLAAAIVGGIIFIPKLLSGIKLPGLPDVPSLNDLLGIAEPNIRQNLPTIPFTAEELAAFDFRESVGRPEVLGGSIFQDAAGTSIQQVADRDTRGKLIFGSDFASSARLADLFARFRKTGRFEPGTNLISDTGRRIRIADLTKAARKSIASKGFQRIRGKLVFNRNASTINGIRVTPRRGPNALGALGAKGVRSQTVLQVSRGRVIETRVLAGFSSRASNKTKAFFNRRGVRTRI